MMDAMRKEPSSSNLSRVWLALLIAGSALFAVGLLVAPDRIWPAWLVALNLAMGLAMAGPVFIAIVRVCSGKWADSLYPIANSMGSCLLWAGALGTLVLLGASSLFSWVHGDEAHLPHVVVQKLGWLNLGFFFARYVLCIVTWWFGMHWMQKKEGRGRPAVWLLWFAVTFSIFSFDWIMSVEPAWFSTMFGVYNFSGIFVSGIAALTLLALKREADGEIAPLSESVRHDLGKLLFAFSFFWAYIWFCQYMLIWYTNLPEETTWFHSRMQGSWLTLTYVSLAINFFIPFLVLLPAPAKAHRWVLARIAVLLLVGRWLDLYIMITPGYFPESPPMGVWEVGPPLAVVAAFFLWTSRPDPTPKAVPAASQSVNPEVLSAS